VGGYQVKITGNRAALLHRTVLGTVLGFGLITPVHAQEITNPDEVQTEVDQVLRKETIVVTAQRRNESARDVPISLTVANEETLQQNQITNITDLPLITPGLNVDRFGISTQPTIRGITTRENSPGMDASVAIYVDGVYQPNQGANGFDLPDVSRIEVSKGPQGTLFGRNAAGGAIQIFTRRPDYEFAGHVGASYGNFDTRKIEGWLNTPLASNVAALTVSGYHEESEGYYRDLVNGGAFGAVDSSLIRGKLLIEPTDWLSFILTGQYSKRDDDSVGAGSPLNGNASARLIPGTIVPDVPYDVAVNDVFTSVENTTLSLNTEADLGFATLTSITASNDVDLGYSVEGDFTSANVSRFIADVYTKTFSQELLLTSADNDSAFNWVTGIFYYNSEGAYDPLGVEANGNIVLRRFGQQETDAYAVFGEATVDISDSLTLIGGVRYSYEEHFLRGHSGTAPNVDLADESWESTTPRISLVYKLTPEINTYFTFSQGFKSGGFNTAGLSSLDPFGPEHVDAYETGIKAEFDGGIRLNAATYYYDYTDQQVLTIVQLPGNVQAQRTLNAASSEIYGFEFDGFMPVTHELSIIGTVSLLHAEYSDYADALVQVPILTNGVPCLCGNAASVIDATGNQLIRAPEFTFSVGLNYENELDIGTLKASTSLFHSSSYAFTTDERIAQDAFENLSARASFKPSGSAATFSVWGQNLTDSTVIEGTSILPNGDGVWYAAPRTYGVSISMDF
jgi:iron complex outermembrane receptor protein